MQYEHRTGHRSHETAKEARKETSLGFIAGYSYNHPNTENGKKLNEKVRKIILSGQCDRFIHYCYAAAMWSNDDILANVIPALKQSLANGAENKNAFWP